MSPDFTPWDATLGGALIGVAASTMLVLEGRIAGISGIVGGLMSLRAGDIGWRLAFLAGLATAGLAAIRMDPSLVANEVARPLWMVALAGLLVGVGTRLGGGCTSGHGVCGMSRANPRSIASVVTFMLVGASAAGLTHLLTGGAP